MDFIIPVVLVFFSVGLLIYGLLAGGLEHVFVAGVLAVFLRVVQSHNQHKDIKRLLREPNMKPKPPSKKDLQRMLEEKQAKRSDS